MFQIVFNEISAAEMSALPKTMQLDLLAEFQFMPEDLEQLDSEKFGAIERDGKKLLRFRTKDYRIYFEKTDEGITVHRVLHKNTIRDFLFRSKLPMTEDDQLGQQKAFWKLIEEGSQTRRQLNVRLWFCVALGVFTAHIAVFMLWTHFQPRPPLRVPPKNEFKVNEKALVDPNTGEKVVVREFTVSTQLATPAPSSKVE